jgi:hypothetical protein
MITTDFTASATDGSSLVWPLVLMAASLALVGFGVGGWRF